MTRYLFEYRYSDGEWTLVGYEVIESSGLETAYFEFENYNINRYIDYSVFEIGKQIK